MTLNLNVTPYFDDYDVNKGYLQILFKPGNSVQARELTQIQTILQQQVSHLSDHFFKEGAMVIPGQSALDLQAGYVKVDLVGSLSSAADFVGKIVQGKSTGIKALVVHHVDAEDLNSDSVIDDVNDEPTTLYLKYLEGAPSSTTVVDSDGDGVNEAILNTTPGTTSFTVNGDTVTIAEGATSTFVEGETLFTSTTDGSNMQATVKLNTAVVNPIGVGSLAFIEEGVYYIQGKLVRVAPQKIILDKYSSQPSYKIGLEIVESLTTSSDDTTLLDNALGTANQSAPGADRLKITLKLTKRAVDVIDTTNFVELIVVQSGTMASVVDTTIYTQLMKTLARRTFDESGDYTVRPFLLDLREYFQENDNEGVYSMPDFVFDTEVAAKSFAVATFPDDVGMIINGEGQAHQISASDLTTYSTQTLDTTATKYYPGLTHDNLIAAARDKIAIGVESGKAYVKGYEIERKPSSNDTKYVMYDKSRTNYQVNNEYIPVDLGTFVYVTDVKGLPKIDTQVKIVNSHIGSTANNDFVSIKEDTTVPADYETVIGYDEDSVFFQAGGTGLGTNTYGIDVIATAKVKAVEYFKDSSSSAKINASTTSSFAPPVVYTETGIWKVYLYDINYEQNPRTSVEYNMADARSIVTESEAVANYYDFGANILTKLTLMDVAGTFTNKCMLYDKYNTNVRAINYYYNSFTGLLLVKQLNAGNLTSEPTGFLPSSGFVLNEVLLEATGVATNGTFPSGTSAATNKISNGTASGRLFSKSVLQNPTGSSVISTGHSWTKTIRNVDAISGNSTVDTQYSVMKQFNASASSSFTFTLTVDGDNVFTNQESLYTVSKIPSASGSNAGLIGIPITFAYSSSMQEVVITINSTGWASGDPANIIAPVKKRVSKEKTKTIVSNHIELPYSLTDVSGTAIAGVAYDNTDVSTSSRTDAAAYLTDIPYLKKTAQNGISPTFTVGTNSDLVLSVSEFQLKKSDINKIVKIYDTCNVTNHAYRVEIAGGTKKNLHEMTKEDFEFAQKAYDFYEQTSTSPFNVDLAPTAGTLAAVTSQLTVNNIVNPFKAELEALYVNGITSIYNPTEVPVKLNDITERYNLFDGQKKSIIQLGKISLKSGSTPCGGRPILIYDYWNHVSSGDYASVDSYSRYEDIPSFDGERLSDFFDFRPVATYEQITGWPYGRGVVSTAKDYPINGSSISADLRAYFGRKDKLYMNPNGDVRVKYGSPSDIPQSPEQPVDGMVLYELETEPYTLGPVSISTKMIDNKRYTMRDIGKLEKRISTLEYYTSLNLLEKDTMDMKVTDENGNDRFKNGFIVDQFENHKIGNVYDGDYRVSIDSDSKTLRPFFTEKNVNMVINAKASNGYALKDGKIYLPYTSTYFITQESSSKTINVNPFAIFSFRGSVSLFPSSDDWKNTKRAPDIVTDNRGDYDNLIKSGVLPENGIMGTTWNSWEKNWTGQSEISRQTVGAGHEGGGWARGHAGNIRRLSRTNVNFTRTGTRDRTGIQEIVSPKDRTQNVGTRILNTEVIPYIRSRDVYFSAEGMKPNTTLYAFFDGVGVSEFCNTTAKLTTTDTNIKVSSDRTQNSLIANVVDNRGKMQLVGATSGFKCTLYDVEFISNTSLKIHFNQHGNTDTQTRHAAAPVIYSAGFQSGEQLIARWPNPSNPSGFIEKNIGTYSTGKVTASNTSLMTDSAGFITGIFTIPDTSNIRFKTGERVFRLTDQIANGSGADTQTETTYTARGIIETVQDQIVLTRVPEFSTRSLAESEAITGNNFSIQGQPFASSGWYDPLAQTIMIDSKDGAFITAVDLFFSTKDTSKPVTCQLRETVNGYPGPRILAQKRVYPKDVQTSEVGNLPTTFIFPSPVFVKHQQEYCIVIMADTQGYRCHISRMGQEALDGTGVISKQPHAGVFFKSQNASTWTADQMEDLKFRVAKAAFATNSTSNVYIENSEYDDGKNDSWSEEFSPNSMKLTADSSKITFFVPDASGCIPTVLWEANGYNYVTLSNIFGTYDVFPHGSLNGSHLVTDTTYNSFTIDMRGQFYPTGSDAPSTAYTATDLPSATNLYTLKSNSVYSPQYRANFKYDLMKPSVQSIELPKTDLTYLYRGLSGTSQDSSKIPGVKDPTYTGFVPNENIKYGAPRMIATEFNEKLFNTTANQLDKKSLVFKIGLSSDNPNVSPVVDTERMSAILISNKTNSPVDIVRGNIGHVNTGFVSELSASGGSAATKYMTREVTLDQASSSLRVIAGVCRQIGCDVDFYYRIKTSEDQIFGELPYNLLVRPTVYENASKVDLEFREYDFDVRNLPEFTSLSVKIVMTTKNSSIIPLIKDLRIIALAS